MDAVIPLDIADTEVSLTGDRSDGEPVAVAEGFELAGGCAAAHISQPMKSPFIQKCYRWRVHSSFKTDEGMLRFRAVLSC